MQKCSKFAENNCKKFAKIECFCCAFFIGPHFIRLQTLIMFPGGRWGLNLFGLDPTSLLYIPPAFILKKIEQWKSNFREKNFNTKEYGLCNKFNFSNNYIFAKCWCFVFHHSTNCSNVVFSIKIPQNLQKIFVNNQRI